MVVSRAPEHCALLQRTPLGGAEILSSSVLSGPMGDPSLVFLLLKELAWHQTRFTLPGLIVCLKGKYSHNDREYNETIMVSKNPTFTTKQHLAAHC